MERYFPRKEDDVVAVRLLTRGIIKFKLPKEDNVPLVCYEFDKNHKLRSPAIPNFVARSYLKYLWLYECNPDCLIGSKATINGIKNTAKLSVDFCEIEKDGNTYLLSGNCLGRGGKAVLLINVLTEEVDPAMIALIRSAGFTIDEILILIDAVPGLNRDLSNIQCTLRVRFRWRSLLHFYNQARKIGINEHRNCIITTL